MWFYNVESEVTINKIKNKQTSKHKTNKAVP